VLAAADGPAAELGRRITEAGVDPEECYQVRDLRVSREDVRVYLTEGYVIFGKAVDGRRLSAVFSGDVEGGDAEVIVLPPTRSERMSLASYTDTPNLDEHITSAVLVFTDDTYAELMKQIQARGTPRRDAERGLLLQQTWEPIVRSFSASFQIRLVRDILTGSRPADGLFYAAVHGRKLGNLDVMYDPQAHEQISVGTVTYRQERAYFDIWTRFQARSFRNRVRTEPQDDLRVNSYRIDATLDPSLHLRVDTQATVIPSTAARRALSFDISTQVRVTEARINGEPAEVFQPESLRSGLIRGDLNRTFLVVPSKPLEAGHEYEVEFRHEGEVVSDAGNGVYFVGARGSWYPNRSGQFSRYDLTFRYPKDLDLVATGKTVEDGVSGPWHITRRRTDSAVRMAGFNVGNYQRHSVSRAGYNIDVYANRTLEAALARKRQQQQIVILPQPKPGPPGNQRWTVDLNPFPLDMPEIDPAARLERLAIEIAGALEFMASHFGPPVLKWVTISPIPGTFGQGFPGLIYLSTLAYLNPQERPVTARSELQELFYSDILHAHETAHQWWGNVVTSASYEDDWIMEALANYSALLYLEKRKGIHAVDQVLASYKAHLLSKSESGNTVESLGPIIWGPRLYSSQAPNAWRIVTYEKGSWIVHMLRRRLGDERFLEMLGQFRQHYQFQAVTTDQFRRVAAAALGPRSLDPRLEGFFDQWVYGTGIPALKLNYKVSGKPPAVRVNGTVTQSEAPEDFSALAPVEIQFRKGKPVVVWVRTSSEPAPFTVTLKQLPAKVMLDPDNGVLRR
jgi:hypothetical protein